MRCTANEMHNIGFFLVADFKPLHPIDHLVLQSKACSLLMGPEGGFTESERKQIDEYQFYSLDIGHRMVGTEITPVVALTLLNLWWEDLSSG